jgi:hypothetical protein
MHRVMVREHIQIINIIYIVGIIVDASSSSVDHIAACVEANETIFIVLDALVRGVSSIISKSGRSSCPCIPGVAGECGGPRGTGVPSCVEDGVVPYSVEIRRNGVGVQIQRENCLSYRRQIFHLC